MINRSWIAFTSMGKTIFNAPDEKTSACTQACVTQDRGSRDKGFAGFKPESKTCDS